MILTTVPPNTDGSVNMQQVLKTSIEVVHLFPEE
jgi:hypothetical protein